MPTTAETYIQNRERSQPNQTNDRSECERTSDSTFTFVAVDTDGNPHEVPDLAVESDRGLRETGLAASDGE